MTNGTILFMGQLIIGKIGKTGIPYSDYIGKFHVSAKPVRHDHKAINIFCIDEMIEIGIPYRVTSGKYCVSAKPRHNFCVL